MTDLVNPNLTRKGQERRKQIQRNLIDAIATKGLDHATVTGDVVPNGTSVGAFMHVYPGGIEQAIEDALQNGSEKWPDSPMELAVGIISNPTYWRAVIQGECGTSPRARIAQQAFRDRLSNWPLTEWQFAIVAAWIHAGNCNDAGFLRGLLDALKPTPNKRSNAA